MRENLVDLYRKHLELQKSRYSPRTVENYCSVAKHIEDAVAKEHGVFFDTEHINDLKGWMLEPWIKHIQGLKPSTREQYSVCSKVFLKFIFQNGYSQTDLSEVIPRAGGKTEKRYGASVDEATEEDGDIDDVVFTDEEIDDLLTCMPESRNDLRDRAIILLLKGCGLRASEVASLTVKPFVVAYKGFVRCLGKGGRIEAIPIPKGAYEAVMTYLRKRFKGNIPTDNDVPLFVSMQGNPMNRFTIYQMLAERQKKCGLHTGVHRMRHTFTTNVEKKYGAAAARDMARHRSLKVTNRYVHTTIQEKMQMAEEMDGGK